MQITHDLDSQRDSVHGDGEDAEGKLRRRLEGSLQRVCDACVGQGAATSMCNDDADWLRAERAAACSAAHARANIVIPGLVPPFLLPPLATAPLCCHRNVTFLFALGAKNVRLTV